MKGDILIIIINLYVLSIIVYYFLIRYLCNSKIWNKELLEYGHLYLMFIPGINIVGVIAMTLEIMKHIKKDKNFLHKFFKLK